MNDRDDICVDAINKLVTSIVITTSYGENLNRVEYYFDAIQRCYATFDIGIDEEMFMEVKSEPSYMDKIIAKNIYNKSGTLAVTRNQALEIIEEYINARVYETIKTFEIVSSEESLSCAEILRKVVPEKDLEFESDYEYEEEY